MFKIKDIYFYSSFLFLVLFCQINIVSDNLVWSKYLFETKEYWRIITGNFTHTNINHLILNLTSFFIISFIFKPNIKEVLFVLIVSSLSVGLMMFNTETVQYAGLSGVLHSYFVYLCFEDLFKGKKSSVFPNYVPVISCFVVFSKILSEQINGASKYTEQLINANVSVESHAFGALSGVILFAFLYVLKKKINPARV